MGRGKHAAVAAIAALMAVMSCVDPITPRSGTPTQDDPGVGSVIAITVGREHSCALTAAGDAYCWGSNEFGQLGTATGATTCLRIDRNIPCERLPRAVGGGLKFLRIAAGGAHTCGIALDGHVYCWGDNQDGQLGDPARLMTNAPVAALTSSLYSDIVAGGAHTCALRTDGVAVCWGSNDFGQLGIATAGSGSVIPVAAVTNLRFASLSAGEKRTCARLSDGTTYCWGSQWVARATDGSEVTRPQAQPLRVVLAPAFWRLSVGGQTTCALALDGVAWCWEANPTGNMGDGTTTGSTTPRPVETGLRFTAISVGSTAACGIVTSGEAYCWGSDGSGQLAIPSGSVNTRCGSTQLSCALNPNRTSGWRAYSAISAGVGEHVCGLTLAGRVYCWGAGTMGQRGDGSAGSQWSPTRVPLP